MAKADVLCPIFTRISAVPDYVRQGQIKQMAVFFGLAGRELRQVLAMSAAVNKTAVMKS